MARKDLIESAEMMRELDEKQYRWVWGGESIGVDELIYYMFSERNKARPTQKKYSLSGSVWITGSKIQRLISVWSGHLP